MTRPVSSRAGIAAGVAAAVLAGMALFETPEIRASVQTVEVRQPAEVPILGDLARRERLRRAAAVGRATGDDVEGFDTLGSASEVLEPDPLPPVTVHRLEDPDSTPTSRSEDSAGPYGEAAVTGSPPTPASSTGPETETSDIPTPPRPFLVSAGVDQTIVIPDSRRLPVVVTLTGLVSAPRGGDLDIAWSQIAGPEPVGFLGDHSLETTVALGAAGEYELRLTVSTGLETRSAEVRITLIVSRPDADAADTVARSGSARFLPTSMREAAAAVAPGVPMPVPTADPESEPISFPDVVAPPNVQDLLSSEEAPVSSTSGNETFAATVTSEPAYPSLTDRRTGAAPIEESASRSFYVSKQGDDRSVGTRAYPYRTIRKGLEQLEPGDTLFIREGTYEQGVHTLSDALSPGLSFDAPVTIRAYPGEEVILQPGTGFAVVYLSGPISYTIWRDLIFDGSHLTYPGAHGIELRNGASFNRFVDVEVRNIGGSGVLVAEGQQNSGNEFLDLVVHDVAQGIDGEGHGIQLGSPDNLIDGGEWYDIHGASGSSSAIYVGGDDGGADGNIVRNARIHDSQFGIVLGGGDANLAYNNLIYDNLGVAARIDFGSGSEGNRFLNNTVVGNPGPAVQVGANGVLTGTEVANNIFWLNGLDAVADAGIDSVIDSNIVIDPQFSGEAERDFRLTAGSPAVDAGRSFPEILFDFDGVPRPQHQGFDAGAYEYPGP